MVYLTTHEELDLLHEELFGKTHEPTLGEVVQVAEEYGMYLGQGSAKMVYLITAANIGTAVLKIPMHSTEQFDNEWVVYGDMPEECEDAFATTNFYVTDEDVCYALMEYVVVAGDYESLESVSGREFAVDYDMTIEYIMEEYYDLDYNTLDEHPMGRLLLGAINFVGEKLNSPEAMSDMRGNPGNFGFNINGEPVFIDWGWTG